MKKRPKRNLKLENLEERKLTAALSWQPTSFISAPQNTSAVISPYSTSSWGGLTYGSYGHTFQPGLAFTNHNETMVCLK
jgi:hypothetical protein